MVVSVEPDDEGDVVGQGSIVDASGLPTTTSSDNPYGDSVPLNQPTRTHYHLSRREILKGVANRFVHSTAYLYFYAGMALASLMTVVLSLWQDCPGTLFYSLELVVNALLIAEVGIRGYAFGKQFWKSTFNIVDLCLVLLCALTLAILFFSHDCTPISAGPGDDEETEQKRQGRSEELLDSFLLIVRNGIQLVRLLAVVRRSGSNVTRRVANIDLDAARRFSLDIDLDDEGALARQRMADGGERRGLFDVEEDDEEL
ncbi:hypothetical protein FA10DRAFT_234054 [Acaromyces ingoldii]|uniref:Ion transport domain-containing protein n=1 Tax=Acaromyces ingoldii TaxID=215250 RepID=A0A316YEY6_9BASI|nr:hypothetical protein FA10DRAFT_234054 [Acaromyces ingoldii]PWN87671.1 hypothetical protein FA10DRAFT_234054 [Acaromyces ingoldii]